MAATVYAVCNQKGGCAKTVTSVNFGIGLAREGKKVLLIDMDAQGSMTASLGYQQPDRLEVTLSDILGGIINDTPLPEGYGILRHEEGVDLIPANIELSGILTILWALTPKCWTLLNGRKRRIAVFGRRKEVCRRGDRRRGILPHRRSSLYSPTRYRCLMWACPLRSPSKS